MSHTRLIEKVREEIKNCNKSMNPSRESVLRILSEVASSLEELAIARAKKADADSACTLELKELREVTGVCLRLVDKADQIIERALVDDPLKKAEWTKIKDKSGLFKAKSPRRTKN